MLNRTRSPSLSCWSDSIRSADHSIFLALFCSSIRAPLLSPLFTARNRQTVTPTTDSELDEDFLASAAKVVEFDRYVRGCLGSAGLLDGGRLSSIFFT